MKIKINKRLLGGNEEYDIINKDIVEGFAGKEGKRVVEHLFRVLTQSLQDYRINDITLISIKKQNLKQVLENMLEKITDISDNDLVTYNFKFSFKGGIIEMPIALPILRGNILTLSNVRYRVIPIVSDLVLNSVKGNLYINIDKKSIELNGKTISYFKNDAIVNNYLVYSPNLYKPNKGYIKIPLTLYEIHKSGFRNVLGCDFEVMDPTNYTMKSDETIFYNQENVYIHEHIKIGIVIKNVDLTHDREFIISQILYVLYNLPVTSDLFEDAVTTNNPDEETSYWNMVIAIIISDGKRSASYALQEVIKHLDVTQHLDEKDAFNMLAKINIHVNSFKELLLTSSINFGKWVNLGLPHTEKRLEVLEHLLKPITNKFNTLFNYLTLIERDKFSNPELQKLFRNRVRQLTIFGLMKNGMSPCLVLDDQSNANHIYMNIKTETKSKKGVALSALIPTASSIYLGNANVVPKSTPHMECTINMTMKVDEDGFIELPKAKVERLEKHLTK